MRGACARRPHQQHPPPSMTGPEHYRRPASQPASIGFVQIFLYIDIYIYIHMYQTLLRLRREFTLRSRCPRRRCLWCPHLTTFVAIMAQDVIPCKGPCHVSSMHAARMVRSTFGQDRTVGSRMYCTNSTSPNVSTRDFGVTGRMSTKGRPV